MESDDYYPVKAKLLNVEQSDRDVEFQFNPKEIRITRSVSWRAAASSKQQTGSAPVQGDHRPASGPVSPDTGVTLPSYQGTAPYQVSINGILFDTFEARTNVDYYIEQLKETVTPVIWLDAKGGVVQSESEGVKRRPPTYIFTFGRSFEFVCAVTKLSWNYSVWLPDGTPLRALVNLELTETTLSASRNAGSGSQNALRTGSTFTIGNSLSASVNLGASVSAGAGFSFSAGASGFV
jgi:hypothetical protein